MGTISSNPNIPFWYQVPYEIQQLLLATVVNWEDTACSEQFIFQALNHPGASLEVLVSAYRYFFYKHNDGMARRLAAQVMEQVRYEESLPDEWDLLAKASDEVDQWDYLPQIRRKVRQLVTNSYWLSTQYGPSDMRTGVHVMPLYDEIGYPLTVQNVTTKPGTLSPIHNHGIWGVVFQMQGEERHTFWQRTNSPDKPFQIEPIGEHVLKPGEFLSLHPGAIHQVETVGQEISLTFQLYGDIQPKGRFKFELETQTAKHF